MTQCHTQAVALFKRRVSLELEEARSQTREAQCISTVSPACLAKQQMALDYLDGEKLVDRFVSYMFSFPRHVRTLDLSTEICRTTAHARVFTLRAFPLPLNPARPARPTHRRKCSNSQERRRPSISEATLPSGRPP